MVILWQHGYCVRRRGGEVAWGGMGGGIRGFPVMVLWQHGYCVCRGGGGGNPRAVSGGPL